MTDVMIAKSDIARFACPVTLALATVGGSLVAACMMPFVAVTIVTAATMRRSLALTTILAIWATNQLLGFTVLGYPHTGYAFAWGGALGIASILAMLAGAIIMGEQNELSTLRTFGAFLIGFAVYEEPGTTNLSSLSPHSPLPTWPPPRRSKLTRRQTWERTPRSASPPPTRSAPQPPRSPPPAATHRRRCPAWSCWACLSSPLPPASRPAAPTPPPPRPCHPAGSPRRRKVPAPNAPAPPFPPHPPWAWPPRSVQRCSACS